MPAGKPTADDKKQQLLQALQKTALGRGLLQYLDDNGITFNVTVEGQIRGDPLVEGLYDGNARTLTMNGLVPMARQLHTFAHEIRHAAQIGYDQKSSDVSAHADPLFLLFTTRLREVDADAFAVYFAYNHTKETGEDIFGALGQMQDIAKIEGRTITPVRRDLLFTAFEKALEGGVDKAMLAAATALVKDKVAMDIYNTEALDLWHRDLLPLLAESLNAPKSVFSQHFAQYARRGGAGNSAAFVEKAKAYAGIFSGLGAPDYLSGTTPENFVKTITTGAEAFDANTQGRISLSNDIYKVLVKEYSALPPRTQGATP